jgi:DNA modification methylase
MENIIVLRNPADLKPRSSNPRTHSKKQINQLRASIKKFHFIGVVLIDGNDGIIAGHGRCEAAKLEGLKEVPTLRVDHLTPEEIRAYVIADNKLAENAGWDRGLLALELNELRIEGLDPGILGFSSAETDALIQELKLVGPENSDDIPSVARQKPAVSRSGDLWQIGNHRLLCGDATQLDDLKTLLGQETAQCVFTDPPYNVPIAGHVSGLGKVKHQEFAMASGEMSQEAFTEFLGTVLQNLAEASADGSIHFICMDWRHAEELLAAGKTAYSELKNLCVWSKTNAGMGSLYRSQHELVFVYKNGDASHINNVELGKNGRHRTNIWEYAGANTFGAERESELAMHPTVKPVALVADAIMDCSHRGGLILDVFAGSGSTIVAAENTERRGYGLEIDPYYVDTILRRMASVSTEPAVLVDTGKTFAEVERLRSAEANDGAALVNEAVTEDAA